MFVEGAVEKKSGKDAYAEKMKKKAAAAEALASKETEKPKEEPKPQEIIEAVEETKAEEAPASTQVSVRQAKPKTRSAKYKSAKSKIDRNKIYKLGDAIKILKEITYAKFDETIELHLVVRAKGVNQNIKLPHSGGKEKKVEVADDKTIEKLKSGKVDFDMLLATPEMMPKLVAFARILGPRGMMPNPKNGTLIKSAKDAEKFSGNTLTIKTEKEQPVIHTAIGKLSQKETEIEDNVNTVFNALPKQIVKAYIKSTMSPSLKLQI